jgi:hypothetical protein
VEISDPAFESTMHSVWQEASRRVDAGDLGGDVWYSWSAVEPARNLFNVGELVRLLGSQARIEGWRRLGTRVLLNFTEQPTTTDEPAPLFAPPAQVDFHVLVPGPSAGEFSRSIASRFIETATAACSFALGRPVGGQLSMCFPSREELRPELDQRRSDVQLGNLARKSVSLDVWDRLVSIGGVESHLRASAALRTYDSAVRQERDDVALILFVASAECLAAPFAPWKKDRLTKRFIAFFDELTSNELDAIVAHANAEEAFGFRRGNRSAKALRRDLLGRMYQMRSAPIHEGLSARPNGIFGFGDTSAGMRRALCSDFVEAAILRYLDSPRTSLVGHPALFADAPGGSTL